MTRTLLTASALWLAGSLPLAAQEPACPVEGAGAPFALHKEWMMEGWERREGDPPFVFVDKMGKYDDTRDSAGVFYDNFAPGDTQLFDDALRYGRNWEGLQNAARSCRRWPARRSRTRSLGVASTRCRSAARPVAGDGTVRR